jgi:hypothetical protein
LKHLLTSTRSALILVPLALAACEAPAPDESPSPSASLSQAVDSPRPTAAREDPHWLEVKFQQGSRVRLRGGRPVDLDGKFLGSPAARALLRRLEAASWARSHAVSEEALEQLRAEGERRSGAPVPDLNLYFRLRVPPGMDIDSVRAELAALEDVEGAWRIPLPVEAPLPPDYSNPASNPTQGYLNAAPSGLSARDAWNNTGGRGAGVRVCDIEYSYNASHADLGAVSFVGPAGVDPFNDTNHGTAVLSIIRGLDNGFGVRGIADQAALLFAAANTASGYNVGAAVTTCANAMSPGDVIVIEQQIAGPNYNPNFPGNSQYGLIAVEWFKPWYDAIRAAVAAGRVVVEAAGNGQQNLDAAVYQTGNNGHYPFLPQNDSGAIIVGAGQSPVASGTPRAPSWFTNYGATVDLHAWGDNVVAAGYGNLFNAEGVNQWYSRSFGGTSSASALMGGVVASLQGVYKARNGNAPATPAWVKQALQAGATPQQGSGNIGGLPNLAASINSIPVGRGAILTGTSLLTQVDDLGWRIQGSGDFNRDGVPDLVWRHAGNGANSLWYMGGAGGATLVSTASLTQVGDLNWQIHGVGDFNRDGVPDLVWRHAGNGANSLWYMGGAGGATLVSTASLTQVGDLSWQIRGVGDFNRDGVPDLVWRHAGNGANSLWYMGDR